MRYRDLSYIAFRALIINKSRTALTMLGIVIGIGSVILMVSVGEAAQRYLLAQIAAFGSDIVFISAGKGDETRGGPPDATFKQTITARDLEKLNSLSWPGPISGVAITRDLVEYGGAQKLTQISGTDQNEPAVFNDVVAQGRFIDAQDLESRARVAVIGAKIADKLFGQEDPLGRTIKVSKQPFRVIGVLEPAGQRFFSDADDQIYMPYTAHFDLFNKDRINFVAIRTGSVRPSEAKDLVRIALRETHNIDNPDGILSKDDFRVASQEDAIRNADTIGSVLSILLGSIASISLVVAGVGIMNIMYVTVTERTREIGLRKAIGARARDVMRQFLAEAIFLTVTAGIAGIIFGITLSWLAIQIILHFQTGWSFAIPWSGAFIGFGVSAGIGIIFGYFPARRAANLSPIESLRYE
jgi:putative ABC transport system permease protein